MSKIHPIKDRLAACLLCTAALLLFLPSCGGRSDSKETPSSTVDGIFETLGTEPGMHLVDDYRTVKPPAPEIDWNGGLSLFELEAVEAEFYSKRVFGRKKEAMRALTKIMDNELNDYEMIYVEMKDLPDDFAFKALPRAFNYDGGLITIETLGIVTINDPYLAGYYVLCDGVPVPYTINGGNELKIRHDVLFGANGENNEYWLELSVDPVFSAGLGRVELFSTNLNYSGFIGGSKASSDDFWAKSDKTTENIPDDCVKTVPPRQGVDNVDEWGGGIKVVMAYLWPYDFDYHADSFMNIYQDRVSDYTVDVKGSDTVIYEFVALAPGKYRTVFYYDYDPVTLDNGKIYIDWEADEENRTLYYPLTFESLSDGGVHTTVATTIPLEDMTEYYMYNMSTSNGYKLINLQ